MKKLNTKNLILMSLPDLKTKLFEMKQQLAKLLLEKRSRKLENTALPSRLSDDIARVSFVINQKKQEN